MRYDRVLDSVAALAGAQWSRLHRDSCPPILAHASSRRRVTTKPYGSHGNLADIWQNPTATMYPRPVLLFVPGGGWMSGRRVGQGYALLQAMVDAGWVCVSIDYRTSPRHAWPAHIEDVREAVAWVRDELKPNFLAISGASAGGHLASLAALTGEPVDAVVSLYGAYDWVNRKNLVGWGTWGLVGTVVARGRWRGLREASPIYKVTPDAPPFLIVNGTRDHLTPVGGARAFHKALSAVSRSETELLEIPHVGHAFDLTNALATHLATERIKQFLKHHYNEKLYR